jgi:dTMP kinase
LIVLEGGDGVGKSSTARRLASRLDALLLCSPDRASPTGVLLDRYLKGDAVMHIYWDATVAQTVFTANRLEKRSVIYEALMMGRDVVMDRYTLSAVVYGAVNGVEREWMALLVQLDWFPDASFVLDVPDSNEELYLERTGFSNSDVDGSELYDRYSCQRDVRERFRFYALGASVPGDPESPENVPTRLVDSSPCLDEVVERIARVVEDEVRPLRGCKTLETWKEYLTRVSEAESPPNATELPNE